MVVYKELGWWDTDEAIDSIRKALKDQIQFGSVVQAISLLKEKYTENYWFNLHTYTGGTIKIKVYCDTVVKILDTVKAS